MKVTFKMDSGTEITTTPENIIINGMPDKCQVSVGYMADASTLVPVMSFAGYYFNVASMAAHDAAIAKRASEQTAAKIAADAMPKHDPTGGVPVPVDADPGR